MTLPPQVTFPTDPVDRVLAAIGDIRKRLSEIETTGGGVRIPQLNGGVIVPGTMPGGALIPGTLEGDWFVFGTELAGVRIPGDLVVDGTLTAGKIVTPAAVIDFLNAGVINAQLFTVDVGVADKLLSNIVVSTNVSTSGLQAVSANMGTLTAGKALFVGATGAKVGLGRALQYTPPGGSLTSFDGMLMADSAGVVTLIADAATGNLQWKGAVLPGSSGLGNITGTIHGASQIQPGTIPGDNLVVEAINTSRLSSTSILAIDLDAASGRIGKLKSTAVDAMTVTGATVQSTAPGSGFARAYMDPTGVYGNDSGGVERFSFKTATGRATLVDATIKTATGYPRLEVSGGKLMLWKNSANNGVLIDGTNGEPRIRFANEELGAIGVDDRYAYIYGDTTGGGTGWQLEVRANAGLQINNWLATGFAPIRGIVQDMSDARTKHLVEPIPNALDKVCAIRGATYFRNEGGPRAAGVVAQDVEHVLPEAIDQAVLPFTGETVKTVNLLALIGLLAAAIREEAAHREDLQARVDLHDAALTALPGGLKRAA